MIMKWTNEDVKLVEKFIDIRNKGFYANGGELTTVYNRVLEKNVASTNCGSCIRQRIAELEVALSQFKKQMEVNNTSEENKESTSPNNEAVKADKKKAGRPKKTD